MKQLTGWLVLFGLALALWLALGAWRTKPGRFIIGSGLCWWVYSHSAAHCSWEIQCAMACGGILAYANRHDPLMVEHEMTARALQRRIAHKKAKQQAKEMGI